MLRAWVALAPLVLAVGCGGRSSLEAPLVAAAGTAGSAGATGGAAGTGGTAGSSSGGSGAGGTAGTGGTAGSGTGGASGAGGSGGTCGGETNCGGLCTDTQTDPNNCGRCFNACPNTATCVSGRCRCPNGGSVCRGQCVDLTSDPNNCGRCGNRCATGWVCGGGSCGSEWARWPMPNPPSTGLPNPASYTASTDVVRDNVTGLMWQRHVDLNDYDWSAAKAYCRGLTLAGHADWRLPTEIELFSLFDYTASNPAIDAAAFPSTPSDYFWSSSPSADLSSAAWNVDFGIQGTIVSDPVTRLRLRCVRGPSGVVARNHYSVANGIVTDNFTGLVWQQSVDPRTFTWGAAQAYCAGLALTGRGWRVPSVKELMTLVDFSVAYPGPTIDAAAFPSTPSDFFWSSSSSLNGPYGAWFVAFKSGRASASSMAFPFRVRCVR